MVWSCKSWHLTKFLPLSRPRLSRVIKSERDWSKIFCKEVTDPSLALQSLLLKAIRSTKCEPVWKGNSNRAMDRPIPSLNLPPSLEYHLFDSVNAAPILRKASKPADLTIQVTDTLKGREGISIRGWWWLRPSGDLSWTKLISEISCCKTAKSRQNR